jgi:hypothetical protein
MIFIPKGAKEKEVIDPDTISRDYSEASRICEEVSHFQFHKGSFDNEQFNNENCKVLYTAKTVQLKVTGTSGPVLPQYNNSGTIQATGYTAKQTNNTDVSLTADTGLFEVPYNKGFHTIDDTELTWHSDFPELVHITFTYQYVRSENDWYIRNESSSPYGAEYGDALWHKIRKNRLQTAIDIDGVKIVGTGPGGVNTGDSFRGTSYTARSLATSVSTIQLLPAGTHTVSGVAGLAPSAELKDNDGNTGRSTMFNRHSVSFSLSDILNSSFASSGTELTGLSVGENCCIGTRSMLVVRYGNGKLLE